MKRESQVTRVLVEDCQSVHMMWSQRHRELGLELLSFVEPTKFLAALQRLKNRIPNIEFYIDQDYGMDRGAGIELARAVRASFPKSPIAMVTSYPGELFVDELSSGVIDAVYGKFPRKIFPDQFTQDYGNGEFTAEDAKKLLASQLPESTSSETRPKTPSSQVTGKPQSSSLLRWLFGTAVVTFVAFPSVSSAADLESTLRNLVSALTGRIFPILALGYLARNIFGHVTGDPNARQETVRVVIGVACLLGLSGVWAFISSQVR